MLLSIIIPYYNSDAWIAGMLDSLLDQDLPKDQYEIIVVDDGSSEYPITLLRYAECHSNIFYYKLNHKGPSGARNLGIQKAQGEWIYFCDSDDYIQTKVLGSLIEIGSKKKAELLFCDWTIVQPTDKPKYKAQNIGNVSEAMSGLEFIENYYSRISLGMGRYLIRKKVIIDNRLFFRDIVYVEDRMFMLEWIPVVQRLLYVDIILYYYVQRETSILHGKKRRNYEVFAEYMTLFQNKLVEMINNSSYSIKSRRVFRYWLDDTSFFLLTNLFRYSSVNTMKCHLIRLTQIDAYPLSVIGKYPIRLIRRMINHKQLWLAACRFYHILPKQVRVLF